MTTKMKSLILLLFTFVAIFVTILLKPFQQNAAYHHFADQRNIAGIPNFFNVISNLPFVFVGVYGLIKIKSSIAPSQINRTYSVLFTSIFLIAFGSAFYHYIPDNKSLLYDRLPMTFVFMAFLCSVITAWIDIRAGAWLLVPLLLLGRSISADLGHRLVCGLQTVGNFR